MLAYDRTPTGATNKGVLQLEATEKHLSTPRLESSSRKPLQCSDIVKI